MATPIVGGLIGKIINSPVTKAAASYVSKNPIVGGLINPSVLAKPFQNKPVLGGALGNAIGVKATNPASNITAPTNTLSSNMTAPVDYSKMKSVPGQGGNLPLKEITPPVDPQAQLKTDLAGKEAELQTKLSELAKAKASEATPPTPTEAPKTPTTYPSLVEQVQRQAEQPSPEYTAQLAQANEYNRKLQESMTNQANAMALNASNPIPLEFQQGRGQVLQTQYGQQQAALGAGYQGASNLLGATTQQQATQQAGLLGAAGLAAPVPATTLGFYKPTTDQFTPLPQGGAASGGVAQAKVGQGADVQTMVGIQAQAQSLASNLSSLIDSAGINPANASVFTSAIHGINQWLNGQAGDPQYQNFANLISEVANKYANILNQSGGTPTDRTQVSHRIINGLASGQNIKQVLSDLDINASDSINALKSASGLSASQGGQTQGGETFGSFFGNK